MLQLERRQLALELARLRTSINLLLQPSQLAFKRPFLRVDSWCLQHPRQAQAGSLGRRLEPAFPVILLPLRKHERMDIQRLRNVLRLDLRMIRQLYRLNLELTAIAFDLLGTDRRRHFFSLER